MFSRRLLRRTYAAFACQTYALQSPRVWLGSNRWVSPTTKTALHFSSFTPLPPPDSKGTPVFNDINFRVGEDPSSESRIRNNDPDAVFVVNGSSRGIGLQMVKTLLERTKGTVVAACRAPSMAEQLQSLAATGRVHMIQLDMEDQNSIEAAAEEIRGKYSRIDVLLNVAGILGDGSNTAGPERSVTRMDREWFEKTMAVNVIGPVMLCKELSPLMRSKQRVKSAKEKRPVSVIANLSARVGSVSDNELGGWYSYRMSKAAMNQATRTMAHELKRQGTWCIALHPGTTDTDLSKPFQRNVKEGKLFPVSFTVGRLLDVVDSMEAENSGGLYDWAGKAIPF